MKEILIPCPSEQLPPKFHHSQSIKGGKAITAMRISAEKGEVFGSEIFQKEIVGMINRSSQHKSYNIIGVKALIKDFEIIKHRICHAF